MRKEIVRLEKMSDKELSIQGFHWTKMRPFSLICLEVCIHPWFLPQESQSHEQHFSTLRSLPKCQLENQFMAHNALKLVCVTLSYKAY